MTTDQLNENTRYRERILFLVWKIFTVKEERLFLGLEMVNIHYQKDICQILIVLTKVKEMYQNFCRKARIKELCQKIKILILNLEGCLEKNFKKSKFQESIAEKTKTKKEKESDDK